VPKLNPHVPQAGGNSIFSLLGQLLGLGPNSDWIIELVILVAAILIFYYLYTNRKKSGEKQSRSKNKYGGLTLTDWLIVGIFGTLTFIPDPIDILTAGIPIIEPVIAIGYFIWRSRTNRTAA
jgi:uncharacterized membrane protein YfcA